MRAPTLPTYNRRGPWPWHAWAATSGTHGGNRSACRPGESDGAAQTESRGLARSQRGCALATDLRAGLTLRPRGTTQSAQTLFGKINKIKFAAAHARCCVLLVPWGLSPAKYVPRCDKLRRTTSLTTLSGLCPSHHSLVHVTAPNGPWLSSSLLGSSRFVSSRRCVCASALTAL